MHKMDRKTLVEPVLANIAKDIKAAWLSFFEMDLFEAFQGPKTTIRDKCCNAEDEAKRREVTIKMLHAIVRKKLEAAMSFRL